jgi:hypothetical protein
MFGHTFRALIVCAAGALLCAQTQPTRDTSRILLSDPMLQLPTSNSVRVVWYTEFRGTRHSLTYGDNNTTVNATSSKMTRMFEDSGSRILGRQQPAQVTERDIWRHEAIATGLTAGRRVPYFVTSINDGGLEIRSDRFTLQPLPAQTAGMKFLLTSDQQNRLMTPANFQKVDETIGNVDAVLMAGDYVDNPHRASEWFDRFDPSWRTAPQPNRPLFPNARPAFFPSFQGRYQDIFPEFPYRGGRILQNAPILGTIGNHEAPGRFRPNATFMLNGQMTTATIDHMDNDPQPRWFAEIRYEQALRANPALNPNNNPAIRERWIRDNSFELTQYFEMWNHPENSPMPESYWWARMGNTCVVSMNVSRVWRVWNVGNTSRGKFQESRPELNNPSEWGFGDMWFETYNRGSVQYDWLKRTLESPACREATFRVVMGHQTMFGLGDNSLPVMADPVATIRYRDANNPNNILSMNKRWPISRAEWERDIQPLVDARRVTDVFYEYPLQADVWRNDIEPLLRANNVQLVHTGHSHVWNRTAVADLNYIETSNVGNSFGAYFRPNPRANPTAWTKRRVANSDFERELLNPQGRFNPENYPQQGDPLGRPPLGPNIFNVMREMEGTEIDLPFVDSNNVTVFTILDTNEGLVSSYAFDTRNPSGPVRKFDEFRLTR